MDKLLSDALRHFRTEQTPERAMIVATLLLRQGDLSENWLPLPVSVNCHGPNNHVIRFPDPTVEGRCREVLQSYQSPVSVFVPLPAGDGVLLETSERFSRTTTRHQSTFLPRDSYSSLRRVTQYMIHAAACPWVVLPPETVEKDEVTA